MSCISPEIEKIGVAIFLCFLILNVVSQILETITSGFVPPRRLSHSVQEVCHRFLVVFIGSEAISEPSGNLAVALGSGWQVATFGEDLLSVRVLCFVHTSMIAQNPVFRCINRYRFRH